MWLPPHEKSDNKDSNIKGVLSSPFLTFFSSQRQQITAVDWSYQSSRFFFRQCLHFMYQPPCFYSTSRYQSFQSITTVSVALNWSPPIHLLQIFHNWSKGVFNHICTTLATYSVISGTCLPPPHVALVMVLEMGAWEPITIAKIHLLWRIYAVKWDNRG